MGRVRALYHRRGRSRRGKCHRQSPSRLCPRGFGRGSRASPGGSHCTSPQGTGLGKETKRGSEMVTATATAMERMPERGMARVMATGRATARGWVRCRPRSGSPSRRDAFGLRGLLPRGRPEPRCRCSSSSALDSRLEREGCTTSRSWRAHRWSDRPAECGRTAQTERRHPMAWGRGHSQSRIGTDPRHPYCCHRRTCPSSLLWGRSRPRAP